MVKLINNILGLCYDAAHDGAFALWDEVKKPTPGGPESIEEYTNRRREADDAKFKMILDKCNCPYCQEKVAPMKLINRFESEGCLVAVTDEEPRLGDTIAIDGEDYKVVDLNHFTSPDGVFAVCVERI